jgi:hypothetical protein
VLCRPALPRYPRRVALPASRHRAALLPLRRHTAQEMNRRERGTLRDDKPMTRPAAMSVTEPPKIIMYYCLSRSTWPLSNNKEVFCWLYRVMRGESLTIGSLICAKPTRSWDQSTSATLHKSWQSYIITNQIFHTWK